MLTKRQCSLVSKAVCDIYDIFYALDKKSLAAPVGNRFDSDFTVKDCLDDLVDILEEIDEAINHVET